jgi:protein-disulfide isomerase
MAVDFEARGTPHFFINGVRVKGAQPIEAFRRVIDAQIEVAEKKLAEGVSRKDLYEVLLKDAKGPSLPKMVEVPTPSHRLPLRGNKWAKITIYQFSDFQCPFCSRVNPTIEEVLAEHGSEVKIEWINFPLPFHKQAPLAAEAAHEIFIQKGDKAFWRYHDLLFETQREGLLRPQLERLATEVGANMKKFNKALDERTHESLVEEEAQLAKKSGVSGTPGFVVNGYFISGAQPYATFKRAISLAKKDLQKK